MDYIVENVHGVVTVRDRATANEPNEIRFIDPHYKDLFKIPEGGQILVSYANGTNKAFICKYLDDYHVLVGWRAYHICEFAESMKAIGATVEPFPEKHVIWSNIDLDLDDWIADLKEEYPDLTQDEYYSMMVEHNSEHLNDERENLNIQCGTDIIAIADIGRWNGRFSGYGIIKSGKISDCLSCPYDYAEWYVDRDGELRSTQIHHDGSNYIYYRKFKEGISDDECDDLFADIYEGRATKEQIDKITEKLGKTVGEVYGWKFPTAQRVSDRSER